MSRGTSVAVVGAGIVGVSVGLELLGRGFKVSLYDRDPLDSRAKASAGNAGAFAYTDVFPLASPGIMRKAPKWLLDPLGPLSIPPQHALTIAPWMLRFWRASRPDRFRAGVKAQSALMGLSQRAVERQIERVKGEALIQREGQLQLYDGETAFHASKAEWDLRDQHGIPFELLTTSDAIAEIQPGISPKFTHAGFTPTWMNVVDPLTWNLHVARAFVQAGGTFEQRDIRALGQDSSQAVLDTSEGSVRCDFVVVAGGATSHHLAKTLGDNFPLETERGYNTSLPAGAFDLRTHLTFSTHGFVVTKINGGPRVGGAVELGGLKLPPNYQRSQTLLNKAATFLPGLKTDGGTQWMGFRPSLPDSMPVIDRSPLANRVIYAFGHGHSGLTQSSATAELVGDILTDRRSEIDTAPFKATRF